MKKIVKTLIILGVVALLIIAGVKIIKTKKAAAAKIPTAKIYPVITKAYIPKMQDVTLTLPYLTLVGNDADIMVSSRIAARVEKIKTSGQKVKKGELIATLDTTDIRGNIHSVKSQIRAAKIGLQNLIQTHKRTKELLAVQGASIEQSQKESTMIASTRAQLNALEQKLHTLNNNLSYAKIKAVTDGVVAKTFVTEGSTAMPGKPLLKLSAHGKSNYLLVRAPGNIKVQGVLFRGKVYEAQPLGSSFNGLLEYKVYVDANDLTSGDRVEASVVIYHSDAIKLPFDAVLNRDGKSYVLKIEGNKATPVQVHIVESGEEGIVIKENLQGKKIVIAKPDILLKLTSGYALSIKE